jgi:hypothetical protein
LLTERARVCQPHIDWHMPFHRHCQQFIHCDWYQEEDGRDGAGSRGRSVLRARQGISVGRREEEKVSSSSQVRSLQRGSPEQQPDAKFGDQDREEDSNNNEDTCGLLHPCSRLLPSFLPPSDLQDAGKLPSTSPCDLHRCQGAQEFGWEKARRGTRTMGIRYPRGRSGMVLISLGRYAPPVFDFGDMLTLPAAWELSSNQAMFSPDRRRNNGKITSIGPNGSVKVDRGVKPAGEHDVFSGLWYRTRRRGRDDARYCKCDN